MTVFIIKCDIITPLIPVGSFWKIYHKVWQAIRGSFTNFKTVITTCDKKILQSVAGITMCDRSYYNVWQLLRSVKTITKWDATYVLS